MLSLRKYFLLLLIAPLFACGFTPVYRSIDGSGGELITDLQSISVDEIAFGRAGQILKTDLERLFGDNQYAHKKYRLHIDLEKRKEGIAIEKNREVTRYNIIITAKYELIKNDGGKVVNKGNSQITGSYDAFESDYATYAAEEDTIIRIVRELAKDIRFRLASSFLDSNKKK